MNIHRYDVDIVFDDEEYHVRGTYSDSQPETREQPGEGVHVNVEDVDYEATIEEEGGVLRTETVALPQYVADMLDRDDKFCEAIEQALRDKEGL